MSKSDTNEIFHDGLPVARNKNIVIQESGEETLVYDLKVNKAHSLNRTSAMIWKLCDGTKSIEEIHEEICKNSNNPVEEEFILLALYQLTNCNLIDQDSLNKEIFDGASRRELIKKLGIASAIALPLVSSITAPKAVTAQSACALPRCVAPGQNLCAGCAGMTVNYTFHATTDGSCSGAVIGTNNNVVCPLSGSSTGVRDITVS